MSDKESNSGRVITIGKSRSSWLASLYDFFIDFHNKTILFQMGRFIFVTYGLVNATAFFVGTLTALIYASLTGKDPATLLVFITLFMFPSVILGSRLISILPEWRELFSNPVEALFKPGYFLHGGVFGGATAIIVYSSITGASALAIMDAMVLALTIGESIARIGCHVYGCCWGRETKGKIAVIYTSIHARVIRDKPHLHGRKIYPVQLFGTVAHLAQFLLLVAMLPLLPHHGMMTSIYLITHPVIRVVLEMFRQDDRGRLFGPVTHTNLYSAIQFAAGIALLDISSISGKPVTFSFISPLSLMLEQPQMFVYLTVIFALTAVAFGVHIDRVGSWISSTSSKPGLSVRKSQLRDTTSGKQSR